MSKRKIPLQGKGRQFRADLWMDEKITGRTLDALRRQVVRFPENVNPRKTAAFKEEYPRQLAQFWKERCRMKICKPGIPHRIDPAPSWERGAGVSPASAVPAFTYLHILRKDIKMKKRILSLLLALVMLLGLLPTVALASGGAPTTERQGRKDVLSD